MISETIWHSLEVPDSYTIPLHQPATPFLVCVPGTDGGVFTNDVFCYVPSLQNIATRGGRSRRHKAVRTGAVCFTIIISSTESLYLRRGKWYLCGVMRVMRVYACLCVYVCVVVGRCVRHAKHPMAG